MGSSNSTLLPLWRTISNRKAIPTPLNKLKEAYKVLYTYKYNHIDYAKCSLFVASKKCSFDSINISANERNNITPYTLYITEWHLPAENPKAADKNVLFANLTNFLKYTMLPPKAVASPRDCNPRLYWNDLLNEYSSINSIGRQECVWNQHGTRKRMVIRNRRRNNQSFVVLIHLPSVTRQF